MLSEKATRREQKAKARMDLFALIARSEQSITRTNVRMGETVSLLRRDYERRQASRRRAGR